MDDLTPQDQAGSTLDQTELDELLLLNGFLAPATEDGAARKSLIDEIKDAILDSGKLSLGEWRALRSKLKEIERLIPTIDLIIELRTQRTGAAQEHPRPAAPPSSPASAAHRRRQKGA